jgi:serine protease Do
MQTLTRYITKMRRQSISTASLLGMTTLLVGTLAWAESPFATPPKDDVAGGDSADIKRPSKAGRSGTKHHKKHSKKLGNATTKTAADPSAKNKTPKVNPLDQAKLGVVQIEKAGKLVALGTVLKDDGRVLTSLSPLDDGNGLKVRYPDGSVANTKVGHSDRIWDLALLVPQSGRWRHGLSASSADPLKSGSKLHSFSQGRKVAQLGNIAFQDKRQSAFGADSKMLSNVFLLNTKVGPKELGSPVVDDNGKVVAMLGRACMPVKGGACSPAPYGVPVSALKTFLMKSPKGAIPPAPWLGLRGVVDKQSPVKGVRVLNVSPDGPADEAGIHGNKNRALSDTIVAVDGVPVDSPKSIGEQISKKGVGDRVKLLLFGQGKFREVTTVLRSVPN